MIEFYIGNIVREPYAFITIFFILFGLYIILVKLLQKNRSNKHYKYWRAFVRQNVQDFEVFKQGRVHRKTFIKSKSELPEIYATHLGNIFLYSSLSVSDLNSILNSYNILRLEEAYELGSSSVAEAIARFNKTNMDFGGHIPRLVDGTTLHRIQEYMQKHKDYVLNHLESFTGHVAEIEVANSLASDGVQVDFPDTVTQKGYDLLINKDYIIEMTGLSESELSINIDNPDMIEVQVKFGNSTSLIREHLNKYTSEVTGIPILAPDHLVEKFSNHPQSAYLIPFSDANIDLDVSTLKLQVSTEAEALLSGDFDSVLNSGLEVPELADNVETITNSITDVPIIGMVVSAVISTRRSYKRYRKQEITKLQAVRNTSYSIGKKFVISISAAKGMAVVSGVVGLNNVIASSYDATRVALNGDTVGVASSASFFDIDGDGDSDILPIIAVLAAGAAIAKGLSSVFDYFKLRRYKKLKALLDDELLSLANVYENLKEKKKHQIKYVVYGQDFKIVQKRLEKASELNRDFCIKMINDKNLARFPPIHYFFVEYAYEELSKALTKIKNERADIITLYESCFNVKGKKSTITFGEKSAAFFIYSYFDYLRHIMGKEAKKIKLAVDEISKDLQIEVEKLNAR